MMPIARILINLRLLLMNKQQQKIWQLVYAPMAVNRINSGAVMVKHLRIWEIWFFNVVQMMVMANVMIQ